MRRNSTTAIAILLFISVGLSCSLFRPNGPLTWNLMLEIEAAAPVGEAVVNRTVMVIERRLDDLGVHNSRVVAQGTPPNGRILVSLPNIPDRNRLKQIITAGGLLELVAVVSPLSPSPVQIYSTREDAVASLGGTTPANRRVLPYGEREGIPTTENRWVVVEVPAIIDGSELRNAAAAQAQAGSDDYQIHFSLRPEGADRFGVWTGSHINSYLGVVLNGEVKSIAYIKSQISDQGEISGRFKKQAAEDLALVLRSGALPAPVKIVDETDIR